LLPEVFTHKKFVEDYLIEVGVLKKRKKLLFEPPFAGFRVMYAPSIARWKARR